MNEPAEESFCPLGVELVLEIPRHPRSALVGAEQEGPTDTNVYSVDRFQRARGALTLLGESERTARVVARGQSLAEPRHAEPRERNASRGAESWCTRHVAVR